VGSGPSVDNFGRIRTTGYLAKVNENFVLPQFQKNSGSPRSLFAKNWLNFRLYSIKHVTEIFLSTTIYILTQFPLILNLLEEIRNF